MKSLQQKIDQMAAEGKLDELIDKLIERMERENYISTQPAQESGRFRRRRGRWAARRRRRGLR